MRETRKPITVKVKLDKRPTKTKAKHKRRKPKHKAIAAAWREVAYVLATARELFTRSFLLRWMLRQNECSRASKGERKAKRRVYEEAMNLLGVPAAIA